MTLVSNRPSPKRRKGRLLCGAKTRAGGCCQVRAEPGKARCRFHGGKSTGPKTKAGRARIAEAQRLRRRGYRERVLASGLRRGDRKEEGAGEKRSYKSKER